MGLAKNEKFEAIGEMPIVFQNRNVRDPALLNNKGAVVDLKGKWKQACFKDDASITLELACGRGEYTLAMAERNPNKNYIGIDVKGNRIYTGAKQALDQGLNNVRFLRTIIEQTPLFFDFGDVDEIWITFPDPFLRGVKWKKRLTSSVLLNTYRKFCKPGTIINLKTDSPELFEFTLSTLSKEGIEPEQVIRDVHKEDHGIAILTEVITYYEKMHLEDNRIIKYVRFKL